jgi:hypothetical protein
VTVDTQGAARRAGDETAGESMSETLEVLETLPTLPAADRRLHEVDGSWQRREPPLPAVAVVGVGAVAAFLAAATHQRLRDGAELRAVADPEYLLVLGAEADLPWADGARYLGWDGSALTLTTHRVLPAADQWRDAALAEDGGDPQSLVVVLPEQILVSETPVRAADPAALAAVFTAGFTTGPLPRQR